MINISVLVLTLNEEGDLPGCLDSVRWSNDIHILDSGSTDRTLEIAQEYGASLCVRSFDGYASQRNAGLALPFKHEWVLILDADERIPDSLAREFSAFLGNVPPDVVACRIRRRDYWGDTWLKHAQISPFYIRLVRPLKVRYEREINETLVTEGKVHDLAGHFQHYPFSKGLSHWMMKHNKYSDMEARLIADNGAGTPSLTRALFDRDFNERRKHQKSLFYRLPFRPLIKLMYMLFVRMSFLDGMPGIRYAILQSIYEYLIQLKTAEIRAGRSASDQG